MKKVSSNLMKHLFIIMLMLLLMAMTACGDGSNAANSKQANNESQQNAAEANYNNQADFQENSGENSNQAAETTYPLTVTDITGVEVVLEQEPQRIVSLVPSETEIAFAIGAGDRVVGVDEYSNYPQEATTLAKVGDVNTNIEAVMALNPDLILANEKMNSEAIAKLRNLGLTVYTSDPITYDETVAHIEQLATMLNTQEASAEVINHMKQTKEDIVAKLQGAEKRKVYLEFSPGWTIGKDTYMDDLVTIAGGINVAADQADWYEVDGEAIVAKNPEVIIYPDFGEEQSSILAGIQSRPGWEVIDAVKNKRIVAVDNDPLVRVGPRLAEGLYSIAAAIHPELFQ